MSASERSKVLTPFFWLTPPQVADRWVKKLVREQQKRQQHQRKTP